MKEIQKEETIRLTIDSRIKSFVEGRVWDGGVISILVKDVDESFHFLDKAKAQDFLNKQAIERFADKSLRKGYFDYTEEHPAGDTVHRYYIEQLSRGKILSFREEVV